MLVLCAWLWLQRAMTQNTSACSAREYITTKARMALQEHHPLTMPYACMHATHMHPHEHVDVPAGCRACSSQSLWVYHMMMGLLPRWQLRQAGLTCCQ